MRGPPNPPRTAARTKGIDAHPALRPSIRKDRRGGTAADFPNVRSSPSQPRERLSAPYNLAALHFSTLRDEVAGLVVPSEYAAALAAGKPVLLVGGAGAHLYEEIPREEVDWALPRRPKVVVNAVLDAMGSRELCKARALFERKYSRSLASESWHKMLLELASSRLLGG